MRLPASLDALHEREFRLLFIGQAVSLLGDGMVAWRWPSPCST